MSKDTKEEIKNLISYYNYHKVEKMIVKRPGFVVDDFKKLLAIMEAELENE